MRYQFLRFPGGKQKAVTFSFDDGCKFDRRLVEVITRYGIKCTFNINSGFINTGNDDWHLSKDEIKELLLDSGNEIAVHGEYHRAPGKQRPIDGIKDVLNCRIQLESLFETIIRGMAYPDSGITSLENGVTYENIRQNLQNLGIVYSRSLGADNNKFNLPEDWYNWIPTAHHTNPCVFDYIDEFNSIDQDNAYIASRNPKLFYLWGHSYEFENNNNWDLLDKICEKLGNKPDVWYATNIEIFDYVNAYNALYYSADGRRIYNPSLLTVWFVIDGKLFSVKSGETINITEDELK